MTSQRDLLRAAAAVLTLAGLIAWSWRTAVSTPPAVRLEGETMGTTYSVVVADGVAPIDLARLRGIVADELEAVDASMSTWRSESELSRFNRHASTSPFAASPALLEVFRIAREVSELTDGAFDVTVAPLVDAWGFGPALRPLPPDTDDLAKERRAVDFRLVEIDAGAGTLAKRIPEVTCDLSAIAKGYAVDRVVAALQAAGHHNTLVEIGGDLRAAGRRGDGRPWQVAIERPTQRRGAARQVVPLSNRALATSGDYRAYYRSAGRRLSHLIDPRSGEPITNGVASVSVVHDSAAIADALATAASVLGPKAGIELASRYGWAISFLVRNAAELEEVRSPAFAGLVADGGPSVALPASPRQPAAGSDAAVQSGSTPTFIAAFVAFGSLMAALGIGLIAGGRRLKGSCGGAADCHCGPLVARRCPRRVAG